MARAAVRHESFLRHAGYRWLWLALVLSLVSAAWFVWLDRQGGFSLPHAGGTWFGYTSGTVGALLILWLTLLGVRKRAMTEGKWSLKAWVSAHVYLGLALAVIASLHSGFQFGWNIHTLAYVLMMIVIASGLLGAIAYVLLPRRLSANRGETTQKQMQELLAGLNHRLHAAAQPLDRHAAAAVRMGIRADLGGHLLQRATGWYPACPARRALRRLTPGKGGGNTALEEVLGLLEQKIVLLGQARRHMRLRTLLQLWLYIHVPTTFALIAALTAHIVSVFFYW